MADALRELFDEMVADEPPLRTTTDAAAAAGRRLRTRRRALWTVAAAATAVALVTAVPTLATTGRPAPPVGPGTVSGLTAPPRPTDAPLDLDALVVRSRYCPSAQPRAQLQTQTSDGSILPDSERAAAAVLAAAPRIAPGLQFIPRVHEYLATSEQWQGRPQVALIFDVGDAAGYGFLSFQIYTEQGVSAADRAQWELDGHLSCVVVQRRDFTDGSVAVDDADGSGPNSTKVYYFAARGYDMNIDALSEPWTTSTGPGGARTPSTLAPRNSVPLTAAQIMALADVVAHA